MAAFNTTRGVPFEPSAASRARARKQMQEVQEEEREQRRLSRRVQLQMEGIRRDQIEQCYRERRRAH